MSRNDDELLTSEAVVGDGASATWVPSISGILKASRVMSRSSAAFPDS